MRLKVCGSSLPRYCMDDPKALGITASGLGAIKIGAELGKNDMPTKEMSDMLDDLFYPNHPPFEHIQTKILDSLEQAASMFEMF